MIRQLKSASSPLAGRRQVLRLGAALGAAMASAQTQAQSGPFPNRPIRIVVQAPPGGFTDIVARSIGEKLAPILGQQVIIDNRPGAGGILAADAVAKAAPDGYTLMFALSGVIIQNMGMYKKLPYDPHKDFTNIASAGVGWTVLAVHKSVPANNLKELAEFAAKNPVSWGSWAPGSTSHLYSEAFNRQYKVNTLAVHYKGEAPMWQDVLGAQIQVGMGSLVAARALIQRGDLKLLAVTTNKRNPSFPNVPTFFEQGASDQVFSLEGWTGFLGPAGLSADIVAKLNGTLRQAASHPDLTQRFAGLGFQIGISTPEESAAIIRREEPLWLKAIKDAGIQPE